MKLFIKDFLFSFAIICLLLLGAEILVDYYPNEFTIKYDRWYENRNDITTLLIGNSHIQTNVDATILGPNSYNMAIAASGASFPIEMGQSYIPQMTKLENVIINFDYVNVYGDSHISSKNVNEILRQNQVNVSHRKQLLYIYSRYLHVGKQCSRFNYAILCGQLNYKTLKRKYYTDLNNNEIEEEDGPFLDPSPRIKKITLEEYYSRINSIVSLAKMLSNKNARLVVVTTPTYGKYYEQLNIKNIELMNNTMDSLSQLYSIEYKNYLFDTCFLHEYLFVDNNHLNRRGTRLFTQRIIEDFEL